MIVVLMVLYGGELGYDTGLLLVYCLHILVIIECVCDVASTVF